ncbi:MAG: hypothetical protein AAGA85_21910 [Bacteroidota bacterium]
MRWSRLSIPIFFWIGAAVPLFAQEAPLKTYAEGANERKFCFYPSTLRMINVKGDPSYNEVINGISKVLVYKLSVGKVDEPLRSVFAQYEDLGFDEYARLYGGGNDVILMGKERLGLDEYVGVAGMEGEYFAFYLKGDMRWDKIPGLLQGLSDNAVLSLLAPINDVVEEEQERRIEQ